ncbi:similar to Saccharomyces cerevisiae YMR094W CTF13 Subunit of the CBF3 complex [Maudiozyma barnettii]|uniref:Similar to Saccharomyces cerevisiae YMR094W CTF13 Subunit of the CBF3 complex n=1 Tax=Maudiozyma barnettii TaxID=61262 RepID=A0A8H2VF34_9SACH|nr:Ctf13p [Kazachstania barnettii]CAB4254434.1 similar to Saccharomyces cerevisiae YMR094W CTF13 Subunit of the CBF3 complex [Kazachstania barnettii]CAD1782379.1 similar to Saccharomyces cerevisiae YMR094W CTF13 Subunit of the CBF3 complex [Kazachstania barnettii]
MDIEFFLNLPTDLRKSVYYHLDGSFTHLEPPSVEDLYSNNSIEVLTNRKKKTALEKILLERLYSIYSPFIDIFEYNPDIVIKWLQFSIWLRYDSIILDCLRLNHSYSGSLIGPIDWIYLDTNLKLSYFNRKGLLQVWYTQNEYFDWIVDCEPLGITDLETNYFRLNMEHFKLSNISKALIQFEKKKLLNDIYQVKFQIMEENIDEICDINETKINSSKINTSNNNILDNTRDSLGSGSSSLYVDDSDNNDDSNTSSRSRKKRKTYTSEKGSKQLDISVVNVLSYLKKMKKLNKISVRGDILYDGLINSHGIRDRRNNAINYLIKRKIEEIEVFQISDLTEYGLSDLTKWDNLQHLSLINIKYCDMNMIIFPKFCQILTLKNITSLKWFDIVPESQGNYFQNNYSKTKLPSLEDDQNLLIYHYKRMTKSKISYKQKLWKNLGALNRINIRHISDILTGRIIIPLTLLSEQRITLCACPENTEIVCL